MKKGIVALVLLLMPTLVYADSISLSCNKTSVSPGETITCNISGTTSSAVSALKAIIKASGVDIIEAKSNTSVWQGDASNGSFDLYTDENKTGTFNIGTVTIKAGSGNGTIGFKEASFYNADFEEVAVSKKDVTINVVSKEETQPSSSQPVTTTTTKPSQNTTGTNTSKSKNAYLKELNIEGVTIGFNKNTFEYAFEVEHSIKSLKISAIAEDSKAKINIEGHENLIDGQNNIVITVTAENGDKLEYKLTVTRLEEEAKSNNANLSSLVIDGHIINFQSSVKSYNITIDDETTVPIKYTTESEKAQVEIEGNKDLKNKSVIKIKVTAENGDSQVYTINVTKKMSNKTKTIIIAICSFIIGMLVGMLTIILVRRIRSRRSL